MTKVNKVVIYTSSLCGFCYKAKSLLKRKNILFDEINVDINYEKKKEMIDRSNGRTSVPQIFFDNQHIGGCDELYKLDQENGLEIFQ
ncbi:glutaredoxin 3 [Alphaproteobacteria bacterium]|nr:glutaredoxin 3 [Alphaproteobacteria bacterium]